MLLMFSKASPALTMTVVFFPVETQESASVVYKGCSCRLVM